MRRLNVREPDHYPWATAHIDDMITLIEELIDSGLAYVVDGSVYYEVGKDPDFGKLAGYGYDEMLAVANERGNYPDDPNKRDPLDFVLWQAAKPGEPTWESPWGAGRPGWHIECSAMSTRYLGPHLDVHCGGEDLVFPHHAAEIAQSEHATGEEPFVRYWMHVAMVRLAGEKMSKSLGNMLFVSDLVERYSPQAVRAYLLFHHYRDEWAADDADERLADAEKMLAHWKEALNRRNGDSEPLEAEPFRAAFEAAMDDDLDTPTAMRELDRLAVALLDAADEGRGVRAAQSLLAELAGVLGLALGKNEAA
jgi:L-cysteine:1D-myo-inositol 2-amino-2-deoxy-alpha-D-glucopyranoside ligase